MKKYKFFFFHRSREGRKRTQSESSEEDRHRWHFWKYYIFKSKFLNLEEKKSLSSLFFLVIFSYSGYILGADPNRRKKAVRRRVKKTREKEAAAAAPHQTNVASAFVTLIVLGFKKECIPPAAFHPFRSLLQNKENE